MSGMAIKTHLRRAWRPRRHVRVVDGRRRFTKLGREVLPLLLIGREERAARRGKGRHLRVVMSGMAQHIVGRSLVGWGST